MAGGDRELKKKFDTTKMSAEELRMCATDDARGVVGKVGMQGGVSWRHPMVLAGVALLTGISTAMYYNSVNHVREGEVGNSNDAAVGDSIPVADAPADAAAS